MSKFATPLESKLNNMRSTILFIVIFSVINIFAIAGGGIYFVFSTYLPQIFISLAIYGDPQLLMPMVILSLVYILPYLLCWIFSKKHVGWMIAALVLFSFDSLFFLIDLPLFLAEGDFSILLDLVIRIYALISLIMGVVYAFKQRKEKASAPAEQALAQTEASEATREITISRKKSFYGCAIPIVIYVNRVEIGRLKNGETNTWKVPANTFELGGVFSNGLGSSSLQIPAGERNIKYEVSIKSGFWTSSILFQPINE